MRVENKQAYGCEFTAKGKYNKKETQKWLH